MNLPSTTFVLCDFGTEFQPDMAFVETPVGFTVEDAFKAILDGQYHSPRGVYRLTDGAWHDHSKIVAEQLCCLPDELLSKSAKDFINYCGMDWREYREAAE